VYQQEPTPKQFLWHNIGWDSVGSMQIISGVILILSLSSIKRSLSKHEQDSFYQHAEAHAPRCGLLCDLVSVIVYYSAENLDNHPTHRNDVIFQWASIFWSIGLMIAQLFLVRIFWDLGKRLRPDMRRLAQLP
jgi:hypothetical protein